MAVDIDPEEREIHALLAAIDFTGARMLEIGCGNGRLSRRAASRARSIIGVDSAFDGLALAAAARPAADRVAFAQASATRLPFADGAFDVVLFGWSL